MRSRLARTDGEASSHGESSLYSEYSDGTRYSDNDSTAAAMQNMERYVQYFIADRILLQKVILRHKL
jgi:hypothetical protein